MTSDSTTSSYASFRQLKAVARRTRKFSFLVLAAVLGVLLSTGGGSAFASNEGPFPEAFQPETAAGFTNTFTAPAGAPTSQCPNGIAGTPGTASALSALNPNLNTTLSPGSSIHFVYTDGTHRSAFTFTIQVCVVVYPEVMFASSDFNPTTGVLTGTAFSVQALDSTGTVIDGASLSGISDPEGNIYYSWTDQPDVPNNDWVCTYARDIGSNQHDGANRKVVPVCFQSVSSIQI